MLSGFFWSSLLSNLGCAGWSGRGTLKVDLGSNLFAVNRIKLIANSVSLCLKHGFIRYEGNVILNNISTHKMALVLVFSVIFYKTLNYVAHRIIRGIFFEHIWVWFSFEYGQAGDWCIKDLDGQMENRGRNRMQWWCLLQYIVGFSLFRGWYSHWWARGSIYYI